MTSQPAEFILQSPFSETFYDMASTCKPLIPAQAELFEETKETELFQPKLIHLYFLICILSTISFHVQILVFNEIIPLIFGHIWMTIKRL